MTGRRVLLALALLAGPAALPAQEIEIRLVPDPRPPTADSLAVGDPFWATVIARGPVGYALLPESVAAAYRPRTELAVLDSERRDGNLRLRLALFRPGAVVLPAVRAAVLDPAGDTLRVQVVADTIHVASVLAPGDTLLADIKPLWAEPGWPWWAWALLALLAAAALALAWWAIRRRRRAPATGSARAVDPYGEARRRIAARREDPPTDGERAAAAGEIGEALRDYLADAWDVPAREWTTFEWLPALPAAAARQRAALGSVFAEVDLVKYARVAPRAGEAPALAGRALEVLDALEEARVRAAEAAMVEAGPGDGGRGIGPRSDVRPEPKEAAS